tara:strand:+ start:136 stop:501 length:366 start_codon:yes stop_codon:yes gene_type:complete
MTIFLKFENAKKLGTMIDKKFHIEPERIGKDQEKYCTDWSLFTKTKDYKPFKRFLPEFPKEYYNGSADFEKQLCVEKALEQKKSKSEIVKKCHVSSEELKEFIEINRIIEELDDIEELIKN